jgi:hypothetical protein
MQKQKKKQIPFGNDRKNGKGNGNGNGNSKGKNAGISPLRCAPVEMTYQHQLGSPPSTWEAAPDIFQGWSLLLSFSP